MGKTRQKKSSSTNLRIRRDGHEDASLYALGGHDTFQISQLTRTHFLLSTKQEITDGTLHARQKLARKGAEKGVLYEKGGKEPKISPYRKILQTLQRSKGTHSTLNRSTQPHTAIILHSHKTTIYNLQTLTPDSRGVARLHFPRAQIKLLNRRFPKPLPL